MNVRTIDDALISPNDTAFTAVKSCCSVSAETLSYSAKFGTSVDSSAPCSVNGIGRVESSVTDSFRHGCQMAIARFLDHMCLALRVSGLWLCYATL